MRAQERMRPLTRNRVAGFVLAAGSGGTWAVAAPPRGWWVLFPVGVAALAIALRGRRVRARALLGAVCGVAFYTPNLVWMTDFNVPGFVAVVVFETVLLSAAAAAVPARGDGRWSGGWWALPAGLVLLEAVQARIPFGGFPLPAFVLGQVDGPFASAAPVGGSLLVTAVAATSGVALAALIVERGRRRVVVAGVAIVVAAAPVAAGAAVATEPAGELDAVVVQGGGPRGLRAIFTDSRQSTERHLAALGDVDGTPDLVLLPENVADVEGGLAGTVLDERLAEHARRLGTSLVVGVTEGDGDRFRNASVLWGPDGARIGRYEKEHRVPFGEYIPMRGLFERLSDDTRFVPRDALVGEGEALLDAPAGALGVVISYEVFFADRVAEGVREGGQLVLAPTNASSYVTDAVPALELAATRLRAREFGRTVLLAAPTGYSAVVQPDGEVTALSELGEQTLLRRDVPLRSGMTPYARLDDAPTVTLAVLALALAPLTHAVRRRHSPRSADRAV